MAKKFIRILAVGLALAMCLAMAVPAFAEEGDLVSESGIVWFDKDLVMDNDATVPDVEFNFVLDTNDHGEGILVEGWEVHTGILTNTVPDTEGEEGATKEEAAIDTEYSVDFDATHPTTPGSDREGAIAAKGQKYATESFSIDFNDIVWPEPGIYRYVLSETDDEVDGIEYTDKVFYIDVYIVIDDETGELGIGNIVVTEDDFLEPDPEKGGSDDTNEDGVVDNPSIPKKEDGTKIDASGPSEPQTPGEKPQEPEEGVVNPEDKLPGNEPVDPDDPNETKGNTDVNKGVSQADFINEYKPLKLELSKTVKGNQGSRIDYFQFTIEISGLADGVYKIVGDNDNQDDGYIVVDSGTGTVTVNLKHGQSISILVPYDTEYDITEVGTVSNADAYKTSTDSAAKNWASTDWNDTANASKLSKNAADEDGMEVDATVAFVNYKEGTIPTGVLMTIAPFAALMGVGLAGGAVVLKKKRED